MVGQLLLQGEEPLIVLQLRGAWVWHLVDCQSSGGWTFYQYFFWDWGLAALCGLLPWPPWWLERVLCQLCWSPQCREEGGENPCSVSVWQTLSTWSVLWLSRLRPWRFLQYMRSCIHLPYTPSGRLDPFIWLLEILSFGCISIDFRVLTPLKHTCTGVYLKIFLKDSLNPGKYGTEM